MRKSPAASEAINNYIERLENNIIEFEKKIIELERNNKTFEQQNSQLQEKLKLSLYRQFGRQTEKFVGEGQLALFDAGEVATLTSPEPGNEKGMVKSYNRSKRRRKQIEERIPRVDELIDITETEKQCACGNALTCIGEDVMERLAMIPEQIHVVRYHVKKYACYECEGSGDEDRPAVRTGKAPANIIPGSIATPELLSSVFTKKYCDYVPFYRQEGAFERIRVNLSLQNMAHWQQQVCEIV